MKYPIVEVEWSDSHSMGGWEARGDRVRYHEGFQNCYSVGYLIKKTREYVILALTHHICDVGETLAIPRGCIKDIEELRK